jgi:dihydrofolate reductase
MGKIIISENTSLDGVVQDPTGDEGFGLGGWASQISDADHQEWAKVLLDEARHATAMLMGRRSDEWFAARWLSRTGEWADRLNSLPKYIVSSTLEEPRWTNATVLKGDVVTEVAKLKHELDGDIVVNASTQLVHTLIDHDLADELRVFIYPIMLGAGDRLFRDIGDKKRVRLVGARAVGDSLAYLTYEFVKGAT